MIPQPIPQKVPRYEDDASNLPLIGDGISARVFAVDATTVRMFTCEYDKVEFMFHLGLVKHYYGHHYTTGWEWEHFARMRVYVLDLVRLEKYNHSKRKHRLQYLMLEAEIDALVRATRFTPISLERPEDYPLSQDLIRFVQQHPRLAKIDLWDDVRYRNVLYHPVTNQIVPLDVIRFQMYGRREP